LKKYKLDLI
jgi:hypothetical protein